MRRTKGDTKGVSPFQRVTPLWTPQNGAKACFRASVVLHLRESQKRRYVITLFTRGNYDNFEVLFFTSLMLIIQMGDKRERKRNVYEEEKKRAQPSFIILPLPHWGRGYRGWGRHQKTGYNSLSYHPGFSILAE
jgi:hypothetical protein